MVNYGDYLKFLRLKQGLTLRAAEAGPGISNAYVSQLENRKVEQPSSSNLYKLADLCQIIYGELTEREGIKK